jgi:hypothetical protein
MLRQHKLNRHMIFAEGSPNLMQGLPRLPAAPHVVPLLLREPEAPPKCHKHHLLEKDLYQMVLHRPVEPAPFIRTWPPMANSLCLEQEQRTIHQSEI